MSAAPTIYCYIEIKYNFNVKRYNRNNLKSTKPISLANGCGGGGGEGGV
jgi:hypothetical protein